MAGGGIKELILAAAAEGFVEPDESSMSREGRFRATDAL